MSDQVDPFVSKTIHQSVIEKNQQVVDKDLSAYRDRVTNRNGAAAFESINPLFRKAACLTVLSEKGCG